MNNASKVRLSVFVLLSIVMCIFAVAYSRELYSVLDPIPENEYGKIIIDGADFSGLFKLLGESFRWFVNIIIITSYMFFLTIFNVLAFVLLRLIGIRKNSYSTEEEVIITKRCMWICSAVSYAAGILLTDISFSLYELSLFWELPLMSYVIYISALKRRQLHENEEENYLS